MLLFAPDDVYSNLQFGRSNLIKLNGKPCLVPQMKMAMGRPCFLRTNSSTKRVHMQSISIQATMLTLLQLLVAWRQIEWATGRLELYILCLWVFQIQRTPLVARTGGAAFMNNTNNAQQVSTDWTQTSHRPAPTHSRNLSHRPPFINYMNPTGDRSNKSGTTSDRSTSANEVEHLLTNQQQSRTSIPNGGGWRTSAALQATCPPSQRNSKYHP